MCLMLFIMTEDPSVRYRVYEQHQQWWHHTPPKSKICNLQQECSLQQWYLMNLVALWAFEVQLDSNWAQVSFRVALFIHALQGTPGDPYLELATVRTCMQQNQSRSRGYEWENCFNFKYQYQKPLLLFPLTCWKHAVAALLISFFFFSHG